MSISEQSINDIKNDEKVRCKMYESDRKLTFSCLVKIAGYSLALVSTQINAFVDLIVKPEMSYFDISHLIAGGASGIIIYVATYLFANHICNIENKRKLTQNAINSLLRATSTLTGNDYLIELTRQVSKLFNTNYTFITKFCENGNVRTIAFLKDNELQENFEYEIKNTPCEFVKEKGPQFFGENVQGLFPKDKWLQDEGIESYYAVPFFDLSGKVSGHMGVMDSKRLMKNDSLFSLLETLAKTAGIEIDRMKSEQALRESENQFRTLFEHAGEALFLINSEGRFVDVNQRACNSLNYSRKKLLSMFIPDVDSMHTIELFKKIFEELKNQQPITLVSKHRRKDGSLFPVEIRSGCIEIKGIPHIFSMVRDITYREKSEEELKKLSTAVEQTADNVIITDINGSIEYVNPAFETLTGYRAKEVIGKTPRVLRSGGHDKKYYKNLWNTVLNGKVFRGILINKKKDGKLFYEEKTITPLKDKEGNITHFLSTGKDITERKSSEIALKESEEHLSSIYNSVSDAIFVIDPQKQCIVESNKQASKITGYSLNELVGMKVKDLHPDDMNIISEVFEVVLEKGSARSNQFSCRKKNGDTIPMELSCARLIIKDKVFILASARDISERQIAEKKRAEALLMTEKAARLSSLGTMAAGISHEINQPLTALKIRVDGMLMWDMSKKKIEVDNLRNNLQFVSDQVDRIDDIIKQMRVLASNKKAETGENVNINMVIRNSLSLIRQKISSKGIMVVLMLAEDLPDFNGRLTSMQQVVINLAFNAIDAMDSINNNNKKITFATNFENDECLLKIRDNGPGICAEDLDRIFDPFFSSKSSGDGMGIGLSVTQQIVISLGGTIKAENNKEGGACFTVAIPV